MNYLKTITAILSAALLAQTNASGTVALPDGISLSISPGGDVVIELAAGRGAIVRQSNNLGLSVGISNPGESLDVTQLTGQGAPFGITIFSEDRARFTFTRNGLTGPDFSLIVDEDGDGIPDLKIENRMKYKMKGIEWERVLPVMKAAEPDSDGNAEKPPGVEREP
jgi:hypothetical protein